MYVGEVGVVDVIIYAGPQSRGLGKDTPLPSLGVEQGLVPLCPLVRLGFGANPELPS